MTIELEDIKHLGFKRNELFSVSNLSTLFAEVDCIRRVIVLSNKTQSLYYFDLSPKDWNRWKLGEVAVVPSGRYCPADFLIEEHELVVSGDFEKKFKTKSELIKFIEDLTKVQ